MTTEMQEIAITEEKPLTGGPDPIKEAELAARILLDRGTEHVIETPHGAVHEIVKNFTLVHIDLPGQEEGAAVYPPGFRSVIGVGVGAGAYILSKFTEELSANTELLQAHRERISKAANLANVELLWKSFNRCPVMLVVGDQAPYEDAAVECNSKLDPTTTSFLKMADAGGLPQLTQPAKLTEAFKYFIQGMGYMASSCMTRLSRSRTTSLSSSYSMDGSRSRTLSQGSQGGQVPPSPSQTMESAGVMGALQKVNPFKFTSQNPGKLMGVIQKVNPFKSTSQAASTVPKASSSGSLDQDASPDAPQSSGTFGGRLQKPPSSGLSSSASSLTDNNNSTTIKQDPAVSTHSETPVSNSGCGSTQLCAAQPASCNPAVAGSCFFAGIRQLGGQNFEFGISGDSEGYIGCALSPDATLGGNDTTYICANVNGTLTFFGAFLNSGSLTVDTVLANNVKGTVNGNRIQCTFSATVPDTTARQAGTNFAIAVVTGAVSSSGQPGSPVSQVLTGVVDISNSSADTVPATGIPVTATVAPTTPSSGRPTYQALSQGQVAETRERERERERERGGREREREGESEGGERGERERDYRAALRES
ncbi:hypothetical protein CRUP_016060, partial [Coryphaenoides rupestris]